MLFTFMHLTGITIPHATTYHSKYLFLSLFLSVCFHVMVENLSWYFQFEPHPQKKLTKGLLSFGLKHLRLGIWFNYFENRVKLETPP